MKLQSKSFILTAAMAGLMLPAAAQTTPATAPATINQRKENQQDRIANGIQSGQLTAGETRNLEKKESEMNQEEHDMRKLDNGHLTAADRATLNQQQNSGFQGYLQAEARCPGTEREPQERSGTAPAQSAGTDCPGREERPVDRRRNRPPGRPRSQRSTKKSTTTAQPMAEH